MRKEVRMPKPNRTRAATVQAPEGRMVRVLFYDDGSYRFRPYEAPLVIEEAFPTGKAQGNKLAPRPRS